MARIKGDNGANNLDGADADDVILGLGGNDNLDGEGGNDRLNGGEGNDKLDGDAGNDRLDGGAGRDVLEGDEGRDILTGGTGNDIFKFDNGDGKDVITDFGNGADRIRFDVDGLNFADLTIKNNAQGDAVITWGDARSSITLDGVDASALSNSDFIFAS